VFREAGFSTIDMMHVLPEKMPMGGSKIEIRISKSETNPKFKNRNPKQCTAIRYAGGSLPGFSSAGGKRFTKCRTRRANK
jgi:hypothetical protein